MTLAAFDFRSPPAGDLERQIAGWMNNACSRAKPTWAGSLAYQAELKPGAVEVVTLGTAMRKLPDAELGFALTTSDPVDGPILLALPRPVLLALLGGLTGEILIELPGDRELTELESSLVSYLIRELFLDPLELAWTGEDPLRLTAGNMTLATAARRGPAGDMTIVARLNVVMPFGEFPIHLLMPRMGRWQRLTAVSAAAPLAFAADQEHIDSLVREMSVELDVVLGTAELTMSDVAGLRAGDLLVLRQKVGDPLDGMVAGERKFQVWPGAVGARAAIQIHMPADG